MEYRELKNGVKASRFGLGGMRFPKIRLSDGKEVIDEDKAIEIIRYAVDHGVNYLDTAYVYAGSEAVVGKALKDGYRERVVLVTKLPVWCAKEPGDLQNLLEEELLRLRTDYIDVYHLHNMASAHWKMARELGAFDFMTRQKELGVAKMIGISIHDWFDHFKMAIDAYPWDLAMVQYNYYDRLFQAGEEGVRYAASKGIPVVSMESLHGGMLANLPPEVRAVFGEFQKGASDAELAYAWLIDQPEISVVLSGVDSLEKLKENLEIFERHAAGELTEGERALYDRAREAWKKVVKVGCTGCRYCIPCPRGVDIPGIFEQFNHLARVRGDQATSQKWLYETLYLDRGRDASLCVACGACEGKCPQKLPIIETLKAAHAVFTAE